MTICVYIGMQIQYDSKKRLANLAKHGVDFTVFPDLWATLVLHERDRRHVAEKRWRAYGNVENVLCVAVFTRRSGAFRVISIRKASKNERIKIGQKLFGRAGRGA